MNPIEKTDFDEKYKTIWKTFANGISGLTKDLIEHAKQAEEGSLHQVLHDLWLTPYDRAPDMFRTLSDEVRGLDEGAKRSNIGSVTGVFFELIAASLVTGYMRHHLPEAKIELNSSGTLRDYLDAGGGRDADIFVSYNNRYVVFETKVSPKKPNLVNVVLLRKKYHSSGKPVEFFLIGGQVNAHPNTIKETKDWACYTNGSDKNQALLKTYKLDTILEKAVDFLRLSTPT